MRLPRFLILTFLLLVFFTAGITTATHFSHQMPYNCIINGDISIQLNTHLEYNVSHSLASASSPDGRYRLHLWGTTQSKVILLEDTRTGEKTILQHDVLEVNRFYETRWSSDSQWVYYTWYSSLRKKNLTLYALGSHQTKTLPELGEALDFSTDSEYLAFTDSTGINFILLRTFDTRSVTAPPAYEAYAWSPVGHQLAYLVNDQLLIVDPDSGSVAQAPYAYSPIFPASRNFFAPEPTITWSPDQQYLVVRNAWWDEDTDHCTVAYHISQIDGNTLHPVETLALKLEYDGGTWELALGDQRARWAEQGDSFLYFTPEGSDVVLRPSYGASPRQLYDLWRFNPDTRHRQLVAAGIGSFSWISNALVLTRAGEHSGTTVELRDLDGNHPVVLKTYPDSIDSWGSCRWLEGGWGFADQVPNHVLMCSFPSGSDTFFVGEHQKMIWSVQAQLVSRPFESFTDDGRFTAIYLEGWDTTGEKRTWFELVDVQNGKAYTMPDELASDLPHAILDSVAIWTAWSLDVLPAPGTSSWLVGITSETFEAPGSALYRLTPSTNHWELLNQGTWSANHLLWSPDRRLFAFTKLLPGDPAPSLIVQQVGGSRHWNLGYFPQYETLAWGQCGGIQALIHEAIRGE